MAECDDNVIYLDQYRNGIALDGDESEKLDPSRPLCINTGGEMATALWDEIAASDEDASTVLVRILSMGLNHCKMVREGWEGPKYSRDQKPVSKLGKFAAHLGLGETETVNCEFRRPEISQEPDTSV